MPQTGSFTAVVLFIILCPSFVLTSPRNVRGRRYKNFLYFQCKKVARAGRRAADAMVLPLGRRTPIARPGYSTRGPPGRFVVRPATLHTRGLVRTVQVSIVKSRQIVGRPLVPATVAARLRVSHGGESNWPNWSRPVGKAVT